MGNSWWPVWSPPDDVVPFVDPPQEHVAEVDRPYPVGYLLEADGMLQQPMRALLPPYSSRGGARS